jgi:hypothetical protein
MEHLFNTPYETYNDRGNEFDNLATTAIREIVAKAVDEDVSLRDLSYVLQGVISMEISMAVLQRNSQIVKQNREARNSEKSS